MGLGAGSRRQALLLAAHAADLHETPCCTLLLTMCPAVLCALRQVAGCCVEALVEPAASNKVVEVIAKQELPNRPFAELFASV
jgi:hypothetical protein